MSLLWKGKPYQFLFSLSTNLQTPKDKSTCKGFSVLWMHFKGVLSAYKESKIKVILIEDITGLPLSMPNANQCRSKFWHWSQCRSMSINSDQSQSFNQCQSIDRQWSALIGIDWHWSALIRIGHWLRESWYYRNCLRIEIAKSHFLPIKSHWKWPSKKLGIFGFLEFLKVVAYDSTIGPHNIYIWEKFISRPLLGIMGFLYTEYTECKKVVGYKNTFFWKVP